MALEAAIYSQDPFGYPPLFKDQYYGYGIHQEEEEEDKLMFNDSIATFFNPPPLQAEDVVLGSASVAPARRKRRRTNNTKKNKEEVESQRMTHIAVERNRRKQMNEYLALLRSLMPSSYVQRGDQASIIGGAINFVKELEQLLQAMQAQKEAKHQQHAQNDDGQAGLTDNGRLSPLFAEFFAFPQYSTRKPTSQAQSPAGDGMDDNLGGVAAVGEIEVAMAESHATVKILARKQQRQLVRLVAGMQGLGFTILHLNVTTSTGSDQTVLYSLSFKVEEVCRLNTADEIAAAVNQMLRRIEEGS
ncbi:unnamed protein product [Linum tenue]|uniref:BHLH domain-containing protein n=1 Tax=Linum tenue TaxID=586396 RepID=A0AAV0HNI4_9ROSI|nr:unnamed protein product [Linum tenue]